MAKINLKADFRDHSYLSVRLTKARRIKKRLPEPLPWIEGDLNIPYLEITEALIFGLNHAVIALSGGFCEHLLRLCLYEKDRGYQKGRRINSELWETLNNKDLIHLLCDAKHLIPIPKEDRTWWFDLSKFIRNSYVHFRIFDILKGETELACDAVTGEEFELPIQPYKDKWAMSKKCMDEERALSFFSELTKKVLKIFDAMNWEGREPKGVADSCLYDQYKKFFSEDFSAYVPGYINIPDDFWVDY